MAGFKKRRAFWAKLDDYGEERVVEDLAMGLKIGELCDLFEMSDTMFYGWLKQSPERHQVYREMRAAQAEGLLDEMLTIADGATAQTVTQDRERIRVRQWLAERWNREEYGNQSGGGVTVAISAGELHLTALKGRRTDELAGKTPIAIGEGDGA